MKKFFVLYSLKQKLSPSIYKTKAIVNKHINTNKSLTYQQFQNQQHAKLFIQKFSSQIKNKPLPLLTPNDINLLVQSIVGKKDDNVNNLNKAKSKKIQTTNKQSNKKGLIDEKINNKQNVQQQINNQPSWIILPNGHAFRNHPTPKQQSTTTHTMDEQKYDSSYSTLNNKHQKQQQQQLTKYQQQNEHLQSLSGGITQQHTTQGLTQQTNFINKKDKLSYWVVWNKNDLQLMKIGKKRAQLGLLLFQLQKEHNKQWLDDNILVKRFKTKKQAISRLQQLKQEKKTILNKLKADKIRQAIKQSGQLLNEQQLQQQTQLQTIKISNKPSQQQKIQQIILNYDDIHQVNYNQQLNNKNIEQNEQIQQKQQYLSYNKQSETQQVSNRKTKKNKKQIKQIQEEKLFWAGDLIKQSQHLQQQILVVEKEKEKQDIIGDNVEQKSRQQKLQQFVVINNKESDNIKQSQSTIGKSQQQMKIAEQHIQKNIQIKQQQSKSIENYQEQTKKQLVNQKNKQQQEKRIGQYKNQQSKQKVYHYHQQQKLRKEQQQQQKQLIKEQQQQKLIKKQQKQIKTIIDKKEQHQLITTSQKTTFKPHPYNKQYLKDIILSRVTKQQQFQQQLNEDNQLSTNKQQQLQSKQQQHQQLQKQQQHQQQQQQFIIYPSLTIRQSPGFAISSYQIKSTKTNTIIQKQSLKLGQYKHQQANLLTIAFALSSTYKYLNNNNNNNNNSSSKKNNNKIKLHINKQILKSMNHNYKLDKKLKQTQQFMHSIQQQYKNRIQYIF